MRYLAPLSLLLLLPVAFFAAARGQWKPAPAARWLRLAAAAPLVISGAGHFLATSAYASIIPPQFPDRPALVILSGACELAGAAGLFLPRARRPASLCLVLLMIAVFPANVHVAGQTVHGIAMPGIPARTAMQAAYILLLLVAGWGIPDFRAR